MSINFSSPLLISSSLSIRLVYYVSFSSIGLKATFILSVTVCLLNMKVGAGSDLIVHVYLCRIFCASPKLSQEPLAFVSLVFFFMILVHLFVSELSMAFIALN